MKKRILFFVLFGLSACEYNDTLVQHLSMNLSGHSAEAITVTYSPSCIYDVNILEIQDSRCPLVVECIWQGEARVTFKIASMTFSLKIGESKTFTANQKNFRLTLKDVVPYPVNFNDDVEKKAVFIIERI